MNSLRVTLVLILVLLASVTVNAESLLEEVFKAAADEQGLCYRYYVGDYNSDGKEDLVANTGVDYDEPGKIWVVTLDEAENLQTIFDLDLPNYGSNLVIDDDEIYIGENEFALIFELHGMQYDYRWDMVFYSQNGTILPRYTRESSKKFRIDQIVCEYTFDFAENYGSSYYYNEETGDEDENFWYFFMPYLASDIRIDAILDAGWDTVPWVKVNSPITYGKANWSGDADLSYEAKVLIDEQSLYIYVEVTDDQVIFTDSTSLKQDHLEIWLCGSSYEEPSLETLYQFGIYKSNAVVFTPEVKKIHDVEYRIQPAQEGYVAEIKIDLSHYLCEPVREYNLLMFTIVASDTDNLTKPAQDTLLASSNLKWGDRNSLGIIWLDPYQDPAADDMWIVKELYRGMWDFWGEQ